MKKVLSVLLAVLMICSCIAVLASCKKKDDTVTDSQQIKNKGYFVCGITVYNPMNYFNEDDELVGFDTEFAEAVAKELGLSAKFQVINWSSKYNELNSGAIDCIWNGFTFGNEDDGVSRTQYVDFSYSYLNNSQCVVTRAADAAIYTSAAAFAGKKGAAEGGSAGESVAQELSDNYTAVAAQANALTELKAGTVDFIVIDVLMANALVGKGDYADLAVNTAVEPEAEVFAIGFRKGSDFTAQVNEAIKKLSSDGTLATIAAKYGLSGALIANIGQ